MDRRQRWFTFREACHYLVEAGAVHSTLGVGAHRDGSYLTIPAGMSFAVKGKFDRDDLNKLISYTREMRRNGEL
jgi:hypothetical protein